MKIYQRVTKEKVIRLLRECGMVSRSEDYTHEQIRSLVATYIVNMPPEERTALLDTIKFLLYEHKREDQ